MLVAVTVLVVATLFVVDAPTARIYSALRVNEFSFKSNTGKGLSLFNPANQPEVIVSNVARVTIAGQGIRIQGKKEAFSGLDLRGDSFAVCTFQNVRTNPLEIQEQSSLNLRTQNVSAQVSVSLRSDHPIINALLTAQPRSDSKSGFDCRGMQSPNGSAEIAGEFVHDDTIRFWTGSPAQIDYRGGDVEVAQGNIPESGELYFAHIVPGQDSQSVFVNDGAACGGDGQWNEVLFRETSKVLKLCNQLLLVRPAKDFYIERVNIAGKKIEVGLTGDVRDIRAGNSDLTLRSEMPSLFDEMAPVWRAVEVAWVTAAALLGLLKLNSVRKKE